MNYVEAATLVEPAAVLELPKVDRPFDIATHNGFITVLSKASGEHRTFRVRTQADDAKFAPGSRVVGLLVGPDNTADYQDFGFVTEDGRIILWKRYRDSEFYGWVARMLANPERWTAKCEFNFDGRCRKCNRPLTDPTSVALGIGPKCRGDE